MGFKVSDVSHGSNPRLARHATDWHGHDTFKFPRRFDPAKFLLGFKVSGPMSTQIWGIRLTWALVLRDLIACEMRAR
jgi:hypothetical protein